MRYLNKVIVNKTRLYALILKHAARMWPARCVCAAHDIINITQIIAETTVVCSIKALLASYCGPWRHFSS